MVVREQDWGTYSFGPKRNPQRRYQSDSSASMCTQYSEAYDRRAFHLNMVNQSGDSLLIVAAQSNQFEAGREAAGRF